MFLAFSPADWAIAVKELIRVTKPGGWIELFEYDMQLQRAGPSFDKLHAACKSSLAFVSFKKKIYVFFLSTTFSIHHPPLP